MITLYKMWLFKIGTWNAINITNLTHHLFWVAFFSFDFLPRKMESTLNEYAQNGNLCKTVEQIRYLSIYLYRMIKNQRPAQIATYTHTYFPKLLTATLTITELGTRIYIVCCCRSDVYCTQYIWRYIHIYFIDIYIYMYIYT